MPDLTATWYPTAARVAVFHEGSKHRMLVRSDADSFTDAVDVCCDYASDLAAKSVTPVQISLKDIDDRWSWTIAGPCPECHAPRALAHDSEEYQCENPECHNYLEIDRENYEDIDHGAI